jgi:hypothetical protein
MISAICHIVFNILWRYHPPFINLHSPTSQEFYGKAAAQSEVVTPKIVKLPSTLFHDYNIEGSLHQILKILLQKKSLPEWKNLNFKDPSFKSFMKQLMEELETVLLKVSLTI